MFCREESWVEILSTRCIDLSSPEKATVKVPSSVLTGMKSPLSQSSSPAKAYFEYEILVHSRLPNRNPKTVFHRFRDFVSLNKNLVYAPLPSLPSKIQLKIASKSELASARIAPLQAYINRILRLPHLNPDDAAAVSRFLGTHT